MKGVKGFSFILASVFILSTSSFSADKELTVTELLDEAQNAIKLAFEARCEIKAPYECAKAKAYYEIAKNETSKLNIEAGKRASIKAIDWALKALAVINSGGEIR